jgi:hypothetical protein
MRRGLRTKSGGNQPCEGRRGRRAAELQIAPAACDAKATGTADFKPPACAKQGDPRRDGRVKRGLREPSNRFATAPLTQEQIFSGAAQRLAAHLPPAVRRPYTARRPMRSCDARAKRYCRRTSKPRTTRRGRSGAAVCWGGPARNASPQRWTGARPRARTSSHQPAPAAPDANRRRRPFERDVMPAHEKPAPRTTSRATPASAKRAFPWRRRRSGAGLEGDTLFAPSDASKIANQERWEPAVRRTKRAASY